MALTQVSKDVLNSSQANITQVGTLANLTVSGNVDVGSVNISPNLATARLSMITTTDTGQLTFNSSLGFRLIDSGTTVLSVDAQGDLGVGTSTPGYRLHVVDTSGYVDAAFQSAVGSDVMVSLRNQSSPNYAFWGADNSSGSAFYANSSANACVFGTTTTNNIQFITDFDERVRILGSTGNVGINTTNPTERLHVVGNAIVTGTVIGNVSGTANNASFLGSIPAANYPNIAAFTSSLTTNGYQKLPGGLIMQWGAITLGGDSPRIFNFPIPFTAACFFVGINRYEGGSSTQVSSYEYTTTGFTIDRDDGISGDILLTYFAVGY